uniref:Uncharacterized protein n=1 Tax=Cacopsylla melanoneura TaxID=428564 RepID=A0A8D8ZHZ6_9HEMI
MYSSIIYNQLLSERPPLHRIKFQVFTKTQKYRKISTMHHHIPLKNQLKKAKENILVTNIPGTWNMSIIVTQKNLLLILTKRTNRTIPRMINLMIAERFHTLIVPKKRKMTKFKPRTKSWKF